MGATMPTLEQGAAMPGDSSTAAIDAVSAPARPPVLTFPEPFASLMSDRIRHPLGTPFGISNFGVNLTYLPPGSISAPRHFHSHQDEFVYILEGTPILVTSAGEMPLRPGMCAGFKAGSGDAHRLLNRSDAMAVYLEVGDRTSGDVVTYPDDDIKIDKGPDGRLRVVRKDGSPY
jgi:uncharacterized cupin superfamily protein